MGRVNVGGGAEQNFTPKPNEHTGKTNEKIMVMQSNNQGYTPNLFIDEEGRKVGVRYKKHFSDSDEILKIFDENMNLVVQSKTLNTSDTIEIVGDEIHYCSGVSMNIQNFLGENLRFKNIIPSPQSEQRRGLWSGFANGYAYVVNIDSRTEDVKLTVRKCDMEGNVLEVHSKPLNGIDVPFAFDIFVTMNIELSEGKNVEELLIFVHNWWNSGVWGASDEGYKTIATAFDFKTGEFDTGTISSKHFYPPHKHYQLSKVNFPLKYGGTLMIDRLLSTSPTYRHVNNVSVLGFANKGLKIWSEPLRINNKIICQLTRNRFISDSKWSERCTSPFRPVKELDYIIRLGMDATIHILDAETLETEVAFEAIERYDSLEEFYYSFNNSNFIEQLTRFKTNRHSRMKYSKYHNCLFYFTAYGDLCYQQLF